MLLTGLAGSEHVAVCGWGGGWGASSSRVPLEPRETLGAQWGGELGTTEELASWQTQGWGLLVLRVGVRGPG